jgi:hypothetical protein
MKTRTLVWLFATLVLALTTFIFDASANDSGLGTIPIPRPPLIRPTPPDLMFVAAGCTRASNNTRLIVFTVMNDTLFGFGSASGDFHIAIQDTAGIWQWIAADSLAPQATRSYTRNVPMAGWYTIHLDRDNQVQEGNENNNIRKVLCP